MLDVLDSDLISEFLLTTGGIIILLFIALITGGFARLLMRRAVRLEYERRQASGGTLSLREQMKDSSRDWWAEFWQGISTEMVGAIMTTIIFGIALVFFQESQAEQRLQEDLVFQMSSPTNSFAIQAVRRLDREGWLTDGTLNRADLANGDLSNARLNGAQMIAVNLTDANLSNAFLTNAILVDAMLDDANLNNTFLLRADLENVDFGDADLSSAYLLAANLKDADLSSAGFDESTTLPDGARWTAEEDLARFTDPDHPNYWRSSTESSPAFSPDAANG